MQCPDCHGTEDWVHKCPICNGTGDILDPILLALIDFVRFITTREYRIIIGKSESPMPVYELLRQWTKNKKKTLEENI